MLLCSSILLSLQFSYLLLVLMTAWSFTNNSKLKTNQYMSFKVIEVMLGINFPKSTEEKLN